MVFFNLYNDWLSFHRFTNIIHAHHLHARLYLINFEPLPVSNIDLSRPNSLVLYNCYYYWALYPFQFVHQ